MPPPMQTPSISETQGLPSVAMPRLTRYSSAKKASMAAASPAIACSRTRRTSPPAQKARPPAPSTMKSATAGSAAQASSADWKPRIIARSSAFSVFGRFISRVAAAPSRRAMIVGSVVSLTRRLPRYPSRGA